MNFNIYSKYYDLLYKDKNYQQEAEYVFDSLSSFYPPKPHSCKIHEILELGCGSGNHAVWLTKKGWNITGIEQSESMVACAKEKDIKNFNPIVGDISNFCLDKHFDAAISLFHVISYLNTNESVLNCFRCVNQHLNNGGIFFFDVWFTPGVYSLKPETRIKRMEDDDVAVTRLAESVMHHDSNVVDVHYQVMVNNKSTNEWSTFSELHPMRHFSMPEIEMIAHVTGFEVINAEEFGTHRKPSDDTWAICFTLKKTIDV